jgi:hypothetical protein
MVSEGQPGRVPTEEDESLEEVAHRVSQPENVIGA